MAQAETERYTELSDSARLKYFRLGPIRTWYEHYSRFDSFTVLYSMSTVYVRLLHDRSMSTVSDSTRSIDRSMGTTVVILLHAVRRKIQWIPQLLGAKILLVFVRILFWSCI